MRKQMRKHIDYDQLQILADLKLTKAEMSRRLGVGRPAITKAIRKLKGYATRVVALEKAKEYGVIQFNVMQDHLDDLKYLKEILDPVHRYNMGDKEGFIAMQRKIESQSAEGEPDQEGKRKQKLNRGRKIKREQKIETFDFTMDPRLLETRIIEVRLKCRDFILEAWKTVASKEEVEAFRETFIETLREVNSEMKCPNCGHIWETDAAERFVDRLRSKRIIRPDIILH